MAYTAVKLADVQKAIAAVTAANKKYNDAKDSSKNTEAAVNSARKTLETAQAKLQSLQSDFDSQKYLTTNSGYKSASSALTAAEKKLNDARSFLDSGQFLEKNSAYQNALKAIQTAEKNRDAAQTRLDNATDRTRASLERALTAANKTVETAYTNADKARAAAEKLAQTSISTAEKAYDTSNANLERARVAAEKVFTQGPMKLAQFAFDKANSAFETAQGKYQSLMDSFQPLLDQRNEAINNVSSYIDTIRGSLGDVTKFADAKQVQTLLGQIQTAVKGTKLDDLIKPVSSMISEIDPLKMAAIPKVNIQGANPDVFANIDPNTGLPILNQEKLDASLKSSNYAKKDQIRNYGSFGWNMASDNALIARGPALVGLDMGTISAGMAGGAKGIVKAGTTIAATDNDFKKAAEQLGINYEDYIKPVKFVPSGGGYNVTETATAQNSKEYTDPVTGETYLARLSGGKYLTKLDRDSLYNDITDRTKDFYLVSNALDNIGNNKQTAHAAILFRSDGSGNLVPVTNEQGAPMANYYNAVRNVTGETWYGDLLPVAAIGLSFALPGLSSALAGQIATATGLSATGGALVAANAALGAGMSALTGGDPIKGAVMAGLGTYAAQNAGQVTKALNIPDSAINSIASVTKLDPNEVKTIIANGVSTAVAGGVTGSKDLVQDVIANVAGNFASSQAKQAVADNLKNLDPKQLAAASDIASNVANVAGNALVGGQNLTQALNAAAPGILSSGISAAGNIVSTTTGAAGFPLQTADQDQYEMQLVAAGFSPEQASTYAKAVFTPGMKGFDLGKIASIEDKFPVSGGAIYAERENELKAPLPQNRRLATYEEAVKYDLTGIPLENGQYAFVMPVDVQQPDYSTIAGQAQAGAPGSMYGSTAIKENLPTGGSPFTGSFLPYYYSKSGSPLGISSAGKAIPMFSDLSGKLSPLQVNVEGGQKPLQIDVEGGQRLPIDVQDEYVKASQQFPLTEQEAAIEDPAQKEAALQQYQQYLQMIKAQQQRTQELINPKSVYYLTPEEQLERRYIDPSELDQSISPFRRGGLASMKRNTKWQ